MVSSMIGTSWLQVGPDVLGPGEHAAYRQHCAQSFQSTGASNNSGHQDPPGTIPSILNTKSFRRWYWRRYVSVSDSWEVPQVEKYDPAPLLTLRSLIHTTATVFNNIHLWVEQLFLLIIFLGWLFVAVLVPQDPRYGGGLAVSSNEKSKDVADFCEKMATMAAFMLSFFTSLNVARWWRLRTQGVGEIWAASSLLTMHVGQMVTKDEHLLNSIRRYARTSLMLVFMKQRGYGKDFHILVNRGLITREEMSLMKKIRFNHAEVMWVWVEQIILMLKRTGSIETEYMLLFFLRIVQQGRDGTALCQGQLGTPIPMQYTHFIGILVKLHNLAVTVLMASIFAGELLNHQQILWLSLLARVAVFPLLYNAILLLNEEIMNPFSGDLIDFPMQKYDRSLEEDGLGYEDAARNLPAWLTDWDPRQHYGARDRGQLEHFHPTVAGISEETLSYRDTQYSCAEGSSVELARSTCRLQPPS